MVNQFDIAEVDLDPTRGKEKGKRRPVLIVSNKFIIESTAFVWVMPITGREKKYPMDIEVKTVNNLVYGTIETVQLRCLDFEARNGKVIDHLSQDLHRDILDTIEVHTEII